MDDIVELLKKSRRAAVMAHVSEDPDAIGSCFAMCCALRELGNEPICYLSEKLEKRYEFIGSDYVAYDGTILGDHDLCICLDCGDKQRLGNRIDIFNDCPVRVNIDHHVTNNCFADLNYIDDHASATGEILYKLFKKCGIQMTRDIARYLYIAISGDTGGFKYSNVSPETMHIGAELIGYKIDHADIARLLFDTESLGSIRLKGELMRNIRSYAKGRVNIICVDDEMLSWYGADDTGSLVEIPRRVEGTEVAACIKYHKGIMKVSLRSNGNVNVADIALGLGRGGGGHTMAAGTTLSTNDLDKAERMVAEVCVTAVEKTLDNIDPK